MGLSETQLSQRLGVPDVFLANEIVACLEIITLSSIGAALRLCCASLKKLPASH
jgi:hypothetical protein